MAEIFLARSRGMANFGRYVVLKRILPERGADEHWIEMFLDEARLVAQLQHPNIAHVFDLGRLGEGYFFTMEYVHGANMREVLVRCSQRGRRLPLATAVGVGVGAASGLDHAHSRRDAEGRPLGIVHRDVSPSNLMLSYEGVVKLVDFGVAKALSRSSVTQSGTVKGKISYLSPEQCRGRPVDHRSDIFALGIVLYEMATTKRLYRRGSDFETMTAIVTESPEPPSRYNPEISASLDEVILRALAKDPGRRQQTAGELLEELEDIAQREGLPISNTHLRRQMRELFGDQPEPWRALEAGVALPKREAEITYTADGLLEEDIESVEVPVVPELDYGVSGPVSNPTSPQRRTAAVAALAAEGAARITQAFSIEVDAAQVPLLDSLRAALVATSELEGEQSSVSGRVASAGATAPDEPGRGGAPPPGGGSSHGITLLDPSGPPGDGAMAPSSAAESGRGIPRAVADSSSGPARSGRITAQPLPGAAGTASTGPVSATAPTLRAQNAEPPRLSEAITIPMVDPAGDKAGYAAAPLPGVLAAGQVTIGAGPGGSGPAPGIWDRPMQLPAAPAASEPAPPGRPPHGTPGYAPKATLLGSAPPPSNRQAPAPGREPGGAPPPADPKLPGVGPASAGPQPAYPSSAPPGRGMSSQPFHAPSPHQLSPVYPRAPIEITSTNRHSAAPPRSRALWVAIALGALMCVGVALGAILAGGDEPASPSPQPAGTPATAIAPDAPAATAVPMATPDAAPDAAAPDAAAPDAAAPDAAAPDAAAPDAPPVKTVANDAPRPADDCKQLSARSAQDLRIRCIKDACERKQLDTARRWAKPLPGSVMRELVAACPGLNTPSPQPRVERPDVPSKPPPCTGPLCRR